MPESIGLIGLGLMGAAFTERLLELGHSVVAFDIDAAKVAAAQSLGASSAASAKDVASQCQTILVCVISTAAVRDVALGERGIVHGATDGTVVVDFSTTVVADTVDIAQQLKAASGAGWVDAPVSGGPPAAAAGSLAIMAGGTDEDIVRVTSLLNSMASTFTHMGDVGAGQTTKMVNRYWSQQLCGVGRSQALAKAGIDVENPMSRLRVRRKQFDEGIVSSHGRQGFCAGGLCTPSLEGLGYGARLGQAIGCTHADEFRGCISLPGARIPRPRGTRRDSYLHTARTG